MHFSVTLFSKMVIEVYLYQYDYLVLLSSAYTIFLARNKAAITQIGAVDIVVASMTQDLFDVEVQINGCTFLRNYTAQSGLS